MVSRTIMLKNLHVEGYRCFKSYFLDDFSRVNLIVGKNNTGKTCILEALEILLEKDKLDVIIKNNKRRKEYIQDQIETKREPFKTDLSQIFYGRTLSSKSVIIIEGQADRKQFVKYELVKPAKQMTLKELLGGSTASRDYYTENSISLMLKIISSTNQDYSMIPVSNSGFLIPPYVRTDLESSILPESPEVNYVLTGDSNPFKAGLLWDKIVLTPNENKVLEAMKIIEPTIEKIAILTRTRREPAIYAKLKDYEQRVSFGSLGDGFKHLFVLAVNLVDASNGYLLVDEIDTGFHYTVMLQMWKLITEIARQYNIQVFATTHSYDCVGALARLYKEFPEYQNEIALYRIEKESPKGIRYSAKEISIAADHQMEIR